MNVADFLGYFTHLRFAEILGYIAAFLVFMTFSMKTMVPLRTVGIASNVFFIAYGYLNPAYPLLVLHLALLPLNIFRLEPDAGAGAPGRERNAGRSRHELNQAFHLDHDDDPRRGDLPER